MRTETDQTATCNAVTSMYSTVLNILPMVIQVYSMHTVCRICKWLISLAKPCEKVTDLFILMEDYVCMMQNVQYSKVLHFAIFKLLCTANSDFLQDNVAFTLHQDGGWGQKSSFMN